MGLISGTSHDAVDACVADFTVDGDTLSTDILHASSTPYPSELNTRIDAALPPAEAPLADVCQLDVEIGQFFASVAASAVARAGGADLVCSAGQTVFHWVEGDRARGSLQLGQPAWIAEATKLPVVADVRSRDIAAGGHGAPLVPIFDVLLVAGFGLGRTWPVAVVNLGGIANLTVVAPGQEPVGYDTGPANALVDAMVRDTTGRPCDTDGELANAGRIDETVLGRMLDEPYFRQAPPKSTGKELFNAAYVRRHIPDSMTVEDAAATLTALTARTLAARLRAHGVRQAIMGGGGVRNPSLMRMISAQLPGVDVRPIDALRVPSDQKEALAFALVGWLTWHSLPGTIPSATGARRAAVLGSINPGAEPLQLPPRPTTAPTRLCLPGAP